MCVKSCLTLWDPMDCSPPSSAVHGIPQARLLEWVAISVSSGSSWTRNRIRSLMSPVRSAYKKQTPLRFSKGCHLTNRYIIDKCSALWGLPWIIAGSFLPLYNTSPLECHLVPSWTKKVIQFLLHLVWLFIFLSFQEHTNTVSCGPYQAINHHCHISELSLNNFIFQGSRFINISTLRMECHIHLQLLMAHTS